MICTAMALAAAKPAHAGPIDQGLQWLDQTIFLPGCLSVDCGCACRTEPFCLPDCVRW
jgi:hypothetical protein